MPHSVSLAENASSISVLTGRGCRDMPELAAGELPHPVSVPTFPPLLSASFSSLPEPPPPLQVAPLTDNRSPVPVPASRRFSFGCAHALQQCFLTANKAQQW